MPPDTKTKIRPQQSCLKCRERKVKVKRSPRHLASSILVYIPDTTPVRSLDPLPCLYNPRPRRRMHVHRERRRPRPHQPSRYHRAVKAGGRPAPRSAKSTAGTGTADAEELASSSVCARPQGVQREGGELEWEFAFFDDNDGVSQRYKS